MTILVTGGGGYIGSHMAHELADAGEAVVVVDDLSTGFRAALPKTVPLVVGDVGNGELIAEVIRSQAVTAIIHFAASIVVPDSVRDPLGYYRNNTMNARALLEAAVKTGVKHFIFSSTAAVYGTPKASPVAENAALKATQQAKHLGKWVLGEDSGLCVLALDGAPGVYSARFC